MKLTNRQAMVLFITLRDTVKMNLIGHYSTSHEARKTLIQDIVDQQGDDLEEVGMD